MSTATVTTVSPQETVAANVRAAMARQRVTGLEVAARLGMTQSAWSRRHTGRTPFDVNEIAVLADVLGVSVADLFAGVVTGGYRCGRAVRHLRLVTSVPAAPYDRMIIGA